MHVLVVDDNPIVRIGLVTLLRRIDQVESVEEACDGIDAISWLARILLMWCSLI